jgi:hypothetical protein
MRVLFALSDAGYAFLRSPADFEGDDRRTPQWFLDNQTSEARQSARATGGQ